MARDYAFWLYILTNRNHSVLYIGITEFFVAQKLAASRAAMLCFHPHIAAIN
jgi:hypothetical protein